MFGTLWDDLGATVFQQVRRVQASQAVLLGSGGILASQQAALDVKPHNGSPDALAEEIGRLLDRAIQRAVEPRRRIAVLVSGGLDSSAVLARAVAIARGANRAEVDAVTWSFAGHGDDRPYLKELCEGLGIVPLRISTADALPRVVPELVTDAAPYTSPTNAPFLLACEKARQRGAEAILTGIGGDEILGGDPRALAHHALNGNWGEAVRRWSQFYGESRAVSLVRMVKVMFSPALGSAFPFSLRVARRQFAAYYWPWAGPRFRQVIREFIRRPHDASWNSPTGEPRLRWMASSHFLAMAEGRGQCEARTGLMMIDPLLDDQLVSAVAGFPQDSLWFGNRERGLFRHAMRQRLPESLRLRPDKAAFDAEICQIVRSSDLKALRALASMKMCGDLGLVEPRKYARQFEIELERPQLGWSAIWPALTIEAFLRSEWGSAQKEATWRATA
jgi:asparagine synthase (glutamine-hydrolysing)